MKSYAVGFAPEAKRQLADLYLYIAAHGSPPVAERYTDAVVAFCESLTTFPLRAAARDALRVNKVATDLSADLGKALFWYRNEPFSAFGYKTAGRLVSEGRTDDLLR